MNLTTILLAATFAAGAYGAPPTSMGSDSARITYKTKQVDGLKIFYREAGSPSRPTVVLLHGFPTSSHMFRDLIPKLAPRYHVIAADMPGYGYSDQPGVNDFQYTFANLAAVMDKFFDSIGLDKYSIYVMDYGSPVGFRIFVKHPARIQAIITQNGNAYNEGLAPFWAEYLEPYWKEKNPTTEAKVRGLVAIQTTRFQYTQGFRNPENVNPDSYSFDQMTLDRPGNVDIQLALFYDYQTNVAQYDQWHESLRKVQPPILAVWGKNDPIFAAPGAEAFKRDVPKTEIHFLDTGHFALEEDLEPISNYILTFLGKNVR
jgi:pimeloyl-ACP methyl ester carboxylesterase